MNSESLSRFSKNSALKRRIEHIKVWQASGLTQGWYCQQHELNVKTFSRWFIAYRLSMLPAKPLLMPVDIQPAATQVIESLRLWYVDPAGEVLSKFCIKNLSLCLKRLPGDWLLHFGHPLLLVETFVNPARFHGTRYIAANWLYLGDTQGFSRTRQSLAWTRSRLRAAQLLAQKN
ncbi:MAG: DUF4338 domain-containing protein [Methylococcaceae bacterium]|nr:DUF4338 domain-containing protein [Methylococcaceae bacterium]